MFWVFVILVVGGVVAVLVTQAKQNAAVKQAAQAAGASDGVRCQHIEGLGLSKGAPCEVWAFPDQLRIRDTQTNRVFNLALDQLRAIEAKTERELREVDKSVVGRAVLGHLLVPGLGAIVGGMSGIGTKKKRGPTHHYLIVNYVDATGELKGITFSADGNLLRLQSFAAAVRKVMAERPEGPAVNL